jgi:hypothetical protein
MTDAIVSFVVLDLLNPNCELLRLLFYIYETINITSDIIHSSIFLYHLPQNFYVHCYTTSLYNYMLYVDGESFGGQPHPQPSSFMLLIQHTNKMLYDIVLQTCEM